MSKALDFIDENLDAVLEVFVDNTTHEGMMGQLHRGELGHSLFERDGEPIGFLIYSQVKDNLYLNALWANVKSTDGEREAFIRHVHELATQLKCVRVVLDTSRDNLARRAESFGFKRHFRMILDL
jgi:hypothetical protein